MSSPSPIRSTLQLQQPELLAPAGDWTCAKAAVENGADAIYFGLERFNARMRAANFTEADLPALMAFLHGRGVKGYVTLNTLIFPQELAEAERYLRTIITAGVDAAIVQDIGLCRLIRHLSPNFPIHASTQMTVTSAAGVAFAQQLGCNLVVLARECSLKEINRIQQQLEAEQLAVPLEVFVHGALCVAYSGQCLTSESLGGRSANRGECAQACRMTYELISDGQPVDLGDRSYLLSPQDLAGLSVLPELIQTGVHCLKIEGRLKAPEYVANVTQVYRAAIDRAMVSLRSEESQQYQAQDAEQYRLEMAFSRGLYSGWFKGINNQELVHARFGKKRGVYLGDVTQVDQDTVTVRLRSPQLQSRQSVVKPGDGLVFEHGQPQAKEEGGRVYRVELEDAGIQDAGIQGAEAQLSFGRRDLDLNRIRLGDRVWKTSDPELERHLRQSYATEVPQFQRPLDLEIHGAVHQPLVVIARDRQGHILRVESAMPLVQAHSKPLTAERLQEQLGRLGNTPFRLEQLELNLQGELMLPVSELNRMRREIVSQLARQLRQPRHWQLRDVQLAELLPATEPAQPAAQLIALVRSLPQLQAATETGLSTLYCELEDPRKYREAVKMARQAGVVLYVAPPRITKPGETWILQQVQDAEADGYLIRNYDQLQFFAGQPASQLASQSASHPIVGDFSLNVANPLTAAYLQKLGLQRLTASYDLNSSQLEALLQTAPPQWFEITIHQHMPMFHMEHCVFCAFLSEGTDYRNCGRPCEQHQVTLRDRVGTEHILQADVGCRNTLFNGLAQTGAEYMQRLINLGAGYFRVEFVNETPAEVMRTLQYYQRLLRGEITGAQLWRELKLHHQLGVTRGTLG
ncbi:MAG: U32 family peptidase [Pegethrix bostrychoides GSE-TBD4-15B]|uniref:U32 family peptidase n=1 Tax=Pegethrix bostrychoides GSE-TBD4-15B TaxID=2839662 RepID=A0A951P7U3_9CYAN|nr:U32 family peptidase [Pegethrix bostrychoides GSE-TBD4-15B]